MLQTKKTSLSSRPPKDSKVNSIEEEKLKKFILEAENPSWKGQSSHKNNEKPSFPWELEGIRNDFYKLFNLRLSESYLLKIEYLSQLRKISKHKLCLDILLPEIDKIIKDL